MLSYSVCKFKTLAAPLHFVNILTEKPRIDDDAALRAKVDEALTVYDEYIKNKGEGESAEPPAAAKEAAKEGEAEETKA